MAFELPKEIREEIIGKYTLLDENGKKKYTQKELGEEYGVRRKYISAVNKTNPETGEKFKSQSEYNNYTIRQITNPETGENFKSEGEYKDYTVIKRINPETDKKFESRSEYHKHLEKQKDLEAIVEE